MRRIFVETRMTSAIGMQEKGGRSQNSARIRLFRIDGESSISNGKGSRSCTCIDNCEHYSSTVRGIGLVLVRDSKCLFDRHVSDRPTHTRVSTQLEHVKFRAWLV